jgi:hypothetical protein
MLWVKTFKENMLTYEQAKEVREGIHLARRNFADNRSIDYDVQVPKGKLRSMAYHRTWRSLVQGRVYFPPKGSSTRFNAKRFGPTIEQQRQALEDGTIFTTFYDDFYAGRINK